MRKGFTQTLTALATVLLATSAMALGPLVSNVPDVYISNAGETYPFVNMFRYSDALVLWDYVTPGTVTTSNTLYWTWAAKNADYNTGLGTGSFLDPGADPLTDTGIHYSIAQENGWVVPPIKPTGSNMDEWTPDINAASTLSQQSMDVVGALTFRNIRLSPLPDANYTTPTAMPSTLPSGVLDFQEATLFVTDGFTTPRTTGVPPTNTALLVTVDVGNDRLSGGPSWTPGCDGSNPSAWPTFSLYGAMAGQGINPTVPSTGIAFSHPTASSIAVDCLQLANTMWDPSHDAYHFGVFNPATDDATLFGTPNPLAAGVLYRLSAMVATDNANTLNNPAIYVGMNARTTIGYGYTLINQGVPSPIGPSTSTPVKCSGYLVPAATGNASIYLGVYDPPIVPSVTSDAEGKITFSDIKIRQVDPNTLVKVADLLTPAIRTTFAFSEIVHAEFPYSFFVASQAILPVFSYTPTSAQGSAVVSLSGRMSSTLPLDNNRGIAGQLFYNLFQPHTDGNLVVAKAMLTASGSGTMPDVLLRIQDHSLNYQGSFWLSPNTAAGPGATARPYYVVLDVPPGKSLEGWDFNMYITVDFNTVNGTITMNSLEVMECQQPAE